MKELCESSVYSRQKGQQENIRWSATLSIVPQDQAPDSPT